MCVCVVKAAPIYSSFLKTKSTQRCDGLSCLRQKGGIVRQACAPLCVRVHVRVSTSSGGGGGLDEKREGKISGRGAVFLRVLTNDSL